MSDLSQLLDDLYAMSGTESDSATATTTTATTAPAATATEEPTRAPAWSSEEALDEVFSSWVPGPSDDAPAAQRSMMADVGGELPVEPPHVDTWLQETEPVEAVLVASVPRWSPSDDDILPARRLAPTRGRRR
jgi:hypothetical protein